MRALPVLFIAVGCGYHAGSFASASGPFVGRPSTVGCLDVAIARRLDASVGPVLAFDFGNRCTRPIVVDFQHARVEGVTLDGRRIPLVAYDPDGDIVEEQIDAQLFGHEAIAYEAHETMASVCVDAASIAHAAGERWQCFTNTAVTR